MIGSHGSSRELPEVLSPEKFKLSVFVRILKNGLGASGKKFGSPEGIQLKKADDYLQSDQLSTILTDCKSLYDALANVETSGLQLTERRSAIEAAGCKVRLSQTNCQARWVNSDRQLADGLTQTDACDHLRKFQTTRILEDHF